MWRSYSFVALVLAACGGAETSSTPGSPDGGGAGSIDGGDEVGADAGPTPGPFTVTFGPVTIPSGEERTQCVVKRVGNTTPMRVHQIHNQLGDHSHHFIVYRVADTVEQPEPFDCYPFFQTIDPSAGAPIMITQREDETLTLPEGVAFSFAEDQMVRLELHYINAGEGDVEITSTSTFVGMPDEEFEHEADFLFIGNPDISIPAQSTYTQGPTYFPLPYDLRDSKFFGMTGHTHQWGTHMYVATTPGPDGEDSPVYDIEDWSWSEPDTAIFDPPFQIPEGGGFRFRCDWFNQSNEQVGFGESANDEMCFFWAYYYPSQGAKICAHSDQFGGGIDLCCPGDTLCAVLIEYLMNN